MNLYIPVGFIEWLDAALYRGGLIRKARHDAIMGKLACGLGDELRAEFREMLLPILSEQAAQRNNCDPFVLGYPVSDVLIAHNTLLRHGRSPLPDWEAYRLDDAHDVIDAFMERTKEMEKLHEHG